MRLHPAVLLALSVICLLTAINGLSEATAQQLTPTHGELSTEDKHHDEKRSLRGEKIDDDDEGEERVSPTSWLVDLFTPKTAEQIAKATKKTEAIKFYSELANSPSFRAKHFRSWKTDRMGVKSLLTHLELWGLDGKKFKAIATKYTEFLASGKLS